MYLKKRNKVYHLFYEDNNGKLKSRSTKCALKVEAMKYAHQFLNELETKVESKKITYLEFTKFYKEHGLNRFSRSYQEFVHYAFDQFGKIVDGSITIDEISTSDVHKFIQWKLQKSGERIVNGYLRTLQAAFQRAIEFGYLETKVFSQVKKLKPVTNPPIFPTMNELDLIIEAEEDKQLKILYKFAFYTGMRMGEIRFLRWKSVNFELNVISIENHEDFTTKSKHSRVIPLNEALREFLIPIKDVQDKESYIFQFEGNVMKKNFLSHRFKRAVRACKDDDGKFTVNQALHFHSLRHGHASHLVMGNVPIAYVRELLGHQSIATTQIYTHIQNENLRVAVNGLPKFWMNILNELRNRGVQDILIACVDGLKGFTEAIASVFPETQVQKCIIHQIRNSFKYISSKDQKQFMKELKPVYNSATAEAGLYELDKLDEKWGKKYPLVIRSWRENWPNLSVFFQYPDEIRRIIYTTNAVEALHRQFGKVTKAKTQFPNDEALTKMLFLSYKDLSKKWTSTLRNWSYVISQFSVIFEERISKFL